MLYNLINQTKILFCRMDPARMETDEEQPLRRDQGRSKAAVREDQVSGAASSDPMGGDVGMESMHGIDAGTPSTVHCSRGFWSFPSPESNA